MKFHVINALNHAEKINYVQSYAIMRKSFKKLPSRAQAGAKEAINLIETFALCLALFVVSNHKSTTSE
jgi:hypothetical protein